MARVLWSEDGPVGRLTLNRPEALNALDEETAAEFSAAARRAARSRTKVVVLEGAGRCFCAGGDLDFIARNQRRSAADLAPRMRRFYGAFLSVRDLPQVTIAKVHGAAVGAGLCLALACDLRVAAFDAKLAFNFVRLGLSPGMAAWPLARAALGDARARELLATGRFFTGRDLLGWGAAAAGAPTAGEMDGVAEDLARAIASGSARSLRLLKAETRLGEDLRPFLAHEARGQARTFRGPDAAEGLAAVRARRPPVFASGR